MWVVVMSVAVEVIVMKGKVVLVRNTKLVILVK